MQGGQPNRRLTTILAADVAGYSRLTSSDEEETLARLRSHRDTIIDPAINQHRGRIANTAGDSVLAEFPSVVEAVRCAAEIQLQIAATDQNSERGTEPDQRVDWRIGINLGDVVEHAGDLLGDGVNIAARIEALAEPGGICLSDDVYRQVRGKIDEIFIDLGEQSLKNIPDPVHVYGVEIDTGERALKVVLREDPLVQRPAVAVLPFANLGGDAEQEYFVDGLTEEIITALSLWRSFPVVARNSTFAFKGTSLDAREIGKRLGARYILQDSVRRGGNRIRVTAQLADAISGHQVWAERYDRDMHDIFAVQDELTEGIVTVVVPELERAEHRKLATSQPSDLDAWDCALHGLAFLNDFSEANNLRAKQMFERAVELDPDYARGHAGLAFTYHRDIQFEFSALNDETLPRVVESARRAVRLDVNDPIAHFILGVALLRTGEHEAGLAQSIRSAELNPNYAHAHNVIGIALTLLGRPEDGFLHFDRALAVSPNDPRLNLIFTYRALGHLVAREPGVPADWTRKAISLQPTHPEPHLYLTSALGNLNRPGEAAASLAEYTRLKPDLSRWRMSWMPFARVEDETYFLDGLRAAGWDG